MSKRRATAKRVEIDHAGHCIGIKDCRFFLHTQVGNAYRVSTVGDYRPLGHKRPLGLPADSFYETMVFRTSPQQEVTDCECRAVADWNELTCERYATEAAARAGHAAMVRKYARRAAAK